MSSSFPWEVRASKEPHIFLQDPSPSGVAWEPLPGSRTRPVPDKDAEQTKHALQCPNSGIFPPPAGSRRGEGGLLDTRLALLGIFPQKPGVLEADGLPEPSAAQHIYGYCVLQVDGFLYSVRVGILHTWFIIQ